MINVSLGSYLLPIFAKTLELFYLQTPAKHCTCSMKRVSELVQLFKKDPFH